jgi:hypothetical protein
MEGDSSGKLYVRALRALRHLVDAMEEYYLRFYGVSFPPRPAEETNASLQERLRGVCDAALSVAEKSLGLAVKGDFVQRVFAVRQAGLSRMFREDIAEAGALAAVQRTLADRVAIETWLCHRHMELVDVLEYVRADYLRPDSGIDRFVEFITNLWDVVNRLEGGNISGRINPFRKTARIIVNEPLRVSPYWGTYKTNRRKAISELTAVLFESFRGVAEKGNVP